MKLRAILALVVLSACGTETNPLPDQSPITRTQAAKPPRVRKNVKDLTEQEREKYVEAVLRLKETPSPYDPSLNYYDQFVAWHLSMYFCDPAHGMHMAMGHGGPLFLPWHRIYLLLFENALREVGDKDLTVPYWDWTDPASTAAVFSQNMMGGDGAPQQGYAVTTGPFRQTKWPLKVHPVGFPWALSATPYLTRHFASLPGALPTSAEIVTLLQVPQYDVAPWDTTSDWALSFRNHLEGFRDLQPTVFCGPDGVMTSVPTFPYALHNVVHGWVGGAIGATPDGVPLLGTMVLPTSPNDPVFFLHHSNVDRLWAQWQRLHPTQTYQPVSGVPHNNATDVMSPFQQAGLILTPTDVESIGSFNYTYQ